jgi:GNAT superfamily N-acetyltransferase
MEPPWDSRCSSSIIRRSWASPESIWKTCSYGRTRAAGVGFALLRELARIARDRDYGRVEWSVLDWNEPAIGFYKKLGAVPMDEWTMFRLTGDAIGKLADRVTSAKSAE